VDPSESSEGHISVFEPPPSETPNTKHQAPEKFQASKHQPQKQMQGANGAQVGF